MPCEVVVSDWNGTIIEYRDERPVLEHIATDIFRACVPLNPRGMVRILRARSQLKRLYREGHRATATDFLREMFRVYNEQIISGTPVSLVQQSVDRFAARDETQGKLDRRVLRSIEAFRRSGKPAGILSAGYGYGIEAVLKAARCDGLFSFCEADGLSERDGRAIEFGLHIYGNKLQILQRLLEDMDLDASRTAYIGDSEDDEGCLEITGYPIVSLLAPDDVKEAFSAKYGALVPANETELTRYLLEA